VSPAVFSVNPGASVTVTVRVSAASVPANNTFNFGTLVLQPHAAGNPNQPVLRLPMAIAVRPPVASLPAQMNATVAAGGTTSVLIPVGNAGGLRLSFNLSNTGTSPYSLASTLPTAAGSGFRSSRYTDAVLPPGVPPGQYAADDFQLLDTTRLSTLVANGFLLSTTPLALATQNITWSIYPDVGGVPAGNPETNPGAAVWSYTALPTAPGVGTANATISLNLATAGQNVILPPGRYWLVVNGRTTFANRWVWYASDTRAPSSGNGLMAISPASGGWTANTSFPGLSWLVDASVACGAGWIGAATPSAGQVAPAGSSNVMLTINAAGLSAGSYSGYACFATNDPARPRAAVRVTLTVTP
jgi:hypothetical protein